jgi:hypothetical protein
MVPSPFVGWFYRVKQIPSKQDIGSSVTTSFITAEFVEDFFAGDAAVFRYLLLLPREIR